MSADTNRCTKCPLPGFRHCHLNCTLIHEEQPKPDTAINVERQKKYMPPRHDFSACALMWRGILLKRFGIDVPLDPETVGLMMVALKINRQAGMHDADNLLDMKGYINTVQSCRDSMTENDHVQERSRIQETLNRVDDKGFV